MAVGMTEVFLTLGAEGNERIGLAVTTIARWLRLLDHVELTVIDASGGRVARYFEPEVHWRTVGATQPCACSKHHVTKVVVPFTGSLRRRHEVARDMQTTEWAIYTDDDLLPPSDPTWLRIALQLLAAYQSDPPWGLVTVALDPPAGAHADGPIREVPNCGGLRFVRRGAVPVPLPDFDDHPGYDHILTQAVRDHGYRVGSIYHPAVTANHLGDDCSSLWDRLPGQPEQAR